MTKLNWEWDNTHDCEIAFHNGYMIKAERDSCPSNPFDDWDGHWPIAACYDKTITCWEKTKGVSILDVLARFPDGQIIHDQKALAQITEAADAGDLSYFLPDEELREDEDGDLVAPKWCTNADALRNWFEAFYDSQKLAVLEKLYQLLGIPCYRTTSRGYSQGDWAEVLVVATPEAQEQFGTCLPEIELDVKADPAIREVSLERRADWIKDKVAEKLLEPTADLYGAWAWGDVYGYTLWKPVFDEDGEVEDWEQLDDSCWGFYGGDHTKSGLEEAALSALPDEHVT